MAVHRLQRRSRDASGNSCGTRWVDARERARTCHERLMSREAFNDTTRRITQAELAAARARL